VNALGSIYHPDPHQILAGVRRDNGQGFRDIMEVIMDGYRVVTSPGSNTMIGAVATNVPFKGRDKQDRANGPCRGAGREPDGAPTPGA
jgi:L-aminopeptidase/D-esterase-like protein